MSTWAADSALARAHSNWRSAARRARHYLAVLTGSLALSAIVGLSLLIVAAAAERHSFLSPPSRAAFPHWMSGPLAGRFPELSHHVHLLRIEFSVAVAAMFLLYLVVLATHRALPAWSVVTAIVAAHVVFFLSPPLSLTDIFNYLNYGRMGALHGLNPYVALPIAAPHDPAYPYTTWHHLRSPYGPLFTLGTYGLAPLGLSTAYWAFKAVIMAASLGSLALLWKCARLVGRSPVAAVAFVGLNPLFLVYGLGGQHNDVLMMLLVLTGVYLMLRSREGLGGAAFASALAVKASAGVLLPVVLLGARRRLHAIAGAALAVVALVAVSLLTFGPHLPNDAAQSKLVVAFAPANELGLGLGLGGVTPGLRMVLEAVLVTAIAAATIYAWRTAGARNGGTGAPGWLVGATAVTLVLIVTLTWVMPWYVFWLLPLAALMRGPWLRAAALVVSVMLLWIWLPLGMDFNHNVLHQKPTRTAVGKQNTRYIHSLLQ